MKVRFLLCSLHSSSIIRQNGYGLQFLPKNFRLDLDDYNKEVEEGLPYYVHGGNGWALLKVLVECELRRLLTFSQKSKRMDGYSFKINFRNQILKVIVNHS
jgi:maltose phosphorylase